MVAERGFSPPQQCVSERIAQHVADVLIPLLREEIVDIVRTISHERIKQRIVEKVADVPVPSQLSNIADVLDATRENLEQIKSDLIHVKMNYEDLVMKHRSVARAAESQVIEEIMEVMPLMSQERTQEHVDDENINVPVPEVMEETIGVVQHNPQKQVRCVDEIIDMPVVMQRLVLASQTVQKTVEVPQVQYTDRIVGVPVVTQRRIPTIQTPQRTVEVPTIVSQDRIQQRTAEQITDTPVPQVAEEVIEMFNVFSQDRVQQRIVEQITETPAVSLAEETMEGTIEEIDISVPHVMEKTSEAVKLIPQERVRNCTVEQIIDVPGVMQGRVPATQTLQKVLADRVVDAPVVTQRHVPLEVPQIQFIRQSHGCASHRAETGAHRPESAEDSRGTSSAIHRQGDERPCDHAEASSSNSSCAENRGGPTDSVH